MTRRAALLILGIAALLPGLARATSLGSYNVDSNAVTVSGISSGGFMAVQLHVAYSSQFHGVAVFAGGPFYCAQDSESNATGYCESGTSIPAASTYADYTNKQVTAGTIDDTSNLSGQPVYMFSGTDDTTVHQAVMDVLQTYYETYTSNITYNKTTAAAHAWISPDATNSCSTFGSPYLNTCNIDPEQTFLGLFYGSLTAKNTGTLGGSFIQFNQDPFCPSGSCSGVSMDSTGWAFVPQSCAMGTKCRLVVVLHGCAQYQGAVGTDLVKGSGVNEWADTNDIIVLYPQATTGTGNPEGCWDWWGYTSSDYALKSGPQMQAIMAMVKQVSGGLPDGGNPGTSTDAGPGADAGLGSDSGTTTGTCTALGSACSGATCCAGSSCQSNICLPGGSGSCTGLGEACSSSSQCCSGSTCQDSLCLPGGTAGTDAGNVTTDAGSAGSDAGPTPTLDAGSHQDAGATTGGGDAGDSASSSSGCGCGSPGGTWGASLLMWLVLWRVRRRSEA